MRDGTRKRCTRCRKLRSLQQFTKHGGRADRRAECRRCERGRKLFKRYGVTLAQYEKLFRKQGGRCGICRRHRRTLVVDHCHATKKVRGLLCPNCNVAIGGLKEDPRLLVRAASYTLDHMEIQTNAHSAD